MAVAPDVFAQGGGIQERLAAALQDPQMRERLLSQMPQIVQQLQGVGGPISQRLAGQPGGVDPMPPALQAEVLRGGLGNPASSSGGRGAPPFVPPEAGGVQGGPPDATLPFFPPGDEMGPVDGGSPPFVPAPGPGEGSPPFFPVPGPDDRQAFADLRNQYGNAEQMADRRQKLQRELDEGREKRADRRGTRPQPTTPGETQRREPQPVRGGPVAVRRMDGGGLGTPQSGGGQRNAPQPSPQKKRRKQGAPPFVPSRGGAYGPVGFASSQ